MSRTRKVCKGCGQELIKLTQGTMQEDGLIVMGETLANWFHKNLGACKETLLNKTKQNRKKGK